MRTLSMIVLVLLGANARAQVECKDVGAPPEDILNGRLSIPDPASCAHWSCTALLLPDELAEEHMTLTLGTGKAGVALVGPGAEAWRLHAIGDGDRHTLSRLEGAPVLTPDHASRVVRFDHGATHGAFWMTPPHGDDMDAPAPCAVLLADGAEHVRLGAWCASHLRVVGVPNAIEIESRGAELLSGTVSMTAPSGRTIVAEVTPDPGALRASVSFTPDEEGDWTVRTIARLRDHTGVERWRSVQQLVRVATPLVALDGAMRVDQRADGRWALVAPAASAGRSGRVLLCAELWGQNKRGETVPVCWIARVQPLEHEATRVHLAIGFDPAWVRRAEVLPETLEARHVRVQSMDGSTILEHHESVPLSVDVRLAHEAIPFGGIAPSMLAAHSGVFVDDISVPGGRSVGGHVLLISHGYCSGGMPFTVPDFSGDIELFEDFNQNRSHDEFALLMAQQGMGYKSMGIVAHSQGGAAAAHLYTFYFSALDWATGNRRIQSVGTPYQGTALAGNAAVLGDLFGAGCGSNADLAYDGAALWISTIPSSTRQEVSYWTTSFEDRPFAFDYCEFVTDFLLTDPDDGVTERENGQFPGANNMGHVTGWCHTDGMREPPQCRDGSRNAELNAEAAR